MPDDDTVQLAALAVVAYFAYRSFNLARGFGDFVGGITGAVGNVFGGVTGAAADLWPF